MDAGQPARSPLWARTRRGKWPILAKNHLIVYLRHPARHLMSRHDAQECVLPCRKEQSPCVQRASARLSHQPSPSTASSEHRDRKNTSPWSFCDQASPRIAFWPPPFPQQHEALNAGLGNFKNVLPTDTPGACATLKVQFGSRCCFPPPCLNLAAFARSQVGSPATFLSAE